MPEKDFEILLQRLDRFIRRYYLNQIIRGILLFFAVGFTYFIMLTLFAYFGNLGVAVRTGLFYSFIFLLAVVFFWFFVKPILGFLKIGKHLSYTEAARIIQQHFPEIQDKLENTLELAEMLNDNNDNSLLFAAIQQKTVEIKPLPFLKAIPLKGALKYFKYLVPPVIVIVVLALFWPATITEGTEKIVNHRVEFAIPAPFSYVLVNQELDVRKGEDVRLEVITEGENLPDKVYLYVNSNRMLMQKVSANQFVYTLKNVNNSFDFLFQSGQIESKIYTLNVLPTPSLLNFSIDVVPPKYTGVESFQLKNQGDMTIPLGTMVYWNFNTRQTDSLQLIFSDSTFNKAESQGNDYKVSKQFFQSLSYQVELGNRNFRDISPIYYNANVVPDLYPEIKIQEKQDSLELSLVYFNGFINDDYGFSSLKFYYSTTSDSDTIKKFIDVPFSNNQNPQEFYFAFDFSTFKDQGVDAINYYFQVGDNDRINGVKFTRSNLKQYRFPSESELNSINDQANKELEDKINKAKELSKMLQKDMQDLQRKLIDKKMSNWEKQQHMQQIAQRQNQLEEITREIAQKNKERNQFMDSYSERKQEIQQKQEQIEELLENLMDEEMRKMIEELNELMKENQTDEMLDLMNDLDMSYDDLNKQLDNNLEMLKRMDVEERLQNNIDQLEKLSKKHQELSNTTKNKEQSPEDLMEKQEDHMQEFNKIQEDYQKTLEKNQELEDPMQMQEFEKSFDEIRKEMQEGKESLEKGKEKKAAGKQQKSSEQMDKLSKQMQQMMDQQMMSSSQENMDDLKQLLENLLQLSFTQEELIEGFGTISSRDPRFAEIVNKQSKIERHYKMVDDSLNALAARVPQIGNIIKEEQKGIKRSLASIMDNISDNRIYKVRTDQQMAMTHINNLALLLSEALDQMQNQQQNMANSEGQCQKKQGQGKPKMGEMRQRQQNMKQQLQEMLQMMKDGKDQSPGGKKQKQISKSLAKMLAEQEIMQQMLNEMMSDQSLSPKSAQMLREINRMMEDNKNDLINRNISPNLLTRQEQIITRMLEAEQSEFERELDKQRKSQEAREYKITNPEKAFNKTREKERFNELLEFSNLKLNKYYRKKYQEYLIKISE